MFDLSFSEIAMIAVVAIIAVGPKELPSLLRSIGQMVAKFRRFTRSIWHQLELESLQSDIKTIQNEAGESFEAYDLSGIDDTSRPQPSPKNIASNHTD